MTLTEFNLPLCLKRHRGFVFQDAHKACLQTFFAFKLAFEFLMTNQQNRKVRWLN
jgi:hypothetical protein